MGQSSYVNRKVKAVVARIEGILGKCRTQLRTSVLLLNNIAEADGECILLDPCVANSRFM